MKVILKPATRAARGKNLTLVWGIHKLPIGRILVALSAEGLCYLGVNCGLEALEKNWPGANLVEDEKITRKTAAEVAGLWPDRLDRLSTPVVLHGTPFQLKVWKALLKIKAGKTATYAEIAKKIGSPKAVRAVGSACGSNTVSIIVPCHRVVSKAGRVNYAWGPAVKRALLKGEKAAGY